MELPLCIAPIGFPYMMIIWRELENRGSLGKAKAEIVDPGAN